MGYIVDEYELMELETDLLRFLLSHLQIACKKELTLLQVALPGITDQIPTMQLEDAMVIVRKEYAMDNKADLNPESKRSTYSSYHRRDAYF